MFLKNGIKKFDSLDQKFNPELHQAVSKVNNDKPEGTIVEEFQRGYMIGDRLLRAAMVVVSMGPEKKEEKNKLQNFHFSLDYLINFILYITLQFFVGSS